MSYLPYRCCCPNTERALDWQWHFDWTQHCCTVAYRHTANHFPCQLAGNLEILHRLIPNPNRNIYRINDRQIGLFQNIFDRHFRRHCWEHLHSNKASKIHPQAVGSVRASQHFNRACWDQRHCGSNALLPWILRQHHALSCATLLLAYYF